MNRSGWKEIILKKVYVYTYALLNDEDTSWEMRRWRLRRCVNVIECTYTFEQQTACSSLSWE
jgi:hypothetical protein